MRTLKAILVALSFAASLSAQQGHQPKRLDAVPPLPRLSHARGGTIMPMTTMIAPWTMTDEQRAAGREALASTKPGRVQAMSKSTEFQEEIDGRVHPDLFMPYELFDRLLHGLSDNAVLRANAHKIYDQKIRAFGYDDTEKFWKAVQFSAGPYLDLIAATPNNAGSSTIKVQGRDVIVPMGHERCAARIGALDTARILLGGKDFDRFLYAVVATQAWHSANGNISAADRAAGLRYMAGGCK